MSNPKDLVVVFSSNAYEAELAKNELENHGIIAFVKDELLGTIAPWHSAPGGAGAVSITVAVEDSEKAKNILQEYFQGETE